MIYFKKMTNDDIDFVVENENKFFNHSIVRDMLKSEINSNPYAYYIIAFMDDLRIGYLSSWMPIPQAEILNLFIINEYQGRGIGLMMLKYAISHFISNNCNSISLEVRKSNYKAINLYSKLGFKNVYIRKNYYQDGEDAILMLKEANYN